MILRLLALVLAASFVSPPAPAASAAAKPRHDLTVSAKEIGGDGTNRFKMFGERADVPRSGSSASSAR